jgi:hypothetical protein
VTRSQNTRNDADHVRRNVPPHRALSTLPTEDNSFEPQEIPYTSKQPAKGKQPVKNPRITEIHSPPPADPQVSLPGQPQRCGAAEFHPIMPHTAPHSAYNKLPAHVRSLYALCKVFMPSFIVSLW